jgi:hypothetical protein
MPLKESKTEENLKYAFGGGSTVHLGNVGLINAGTIGEKHGHKD